MNIRDAIVCMALLCLSGTLHAETCSGGAGGGMDVTGNECNDSLPEVMPPAVEPGTMETPASTLILASLVANDWQAIAATDASTLAGRTEGSVQLGRGLEEYDLGHYAQAVLNLRRAAGLGDARATELLALMFRYGERLYGVQVPADRAEAARWEAIASGRRKPSNPVSSAFGD